MNALRAKRIGLASRCLCGEMLACGLTVRTGGQTFTLLPC
jgi:hypothetical protein